MVLLVVGGSLGGGTDSLLKTAIERGVTPVLVCLSPMELNYEASPFVCLEVDPTDKTAIREAIEGFGEAVSGVCTASELSTVAAAELAEEWNLPGPSSEAVRICRSKIRTRDTLAAKAPFLNPRYRVVRSVSEVIEAYGAIGPEVVIKRSDLSGSIGVHFARSEAECVAAFSFLSSEGELLGQQFDGLLLIEECMKGPEYSVEMFDGKSLSITGKTLGGTSGIVELGHELPAQLSASDEIDIAAAAEVGVGAVGLTWGAAHVEVIVTGDGVRLVEINSRLGGGKITDLIRLATGVDLTGRLVAKSLGLSPPTEVRSEKIACVALKTFSQSGIVRSITGVEVALDVTDVAQVGSFRPVGYRHKHLGSNHDYAAWAIAVGVERDLVRQHASRAVSLVEIDIKGVPNNS